jgi:hypothetical protein
MPPGELPQALATLAVILDSRVVHHHGTAADLPAFEAGPPHSAAHPFDDESSLELGDGADNHADGPAQRSAGVDIFPERDELDLEPGQLIQDFEVMFYRSRDPV